MRRLVSNMPDDHVLVKLDFSNAYNSVRRDTVLESVADKMSELYRFTRASLACSPKLIYNTYTIESAEGSQQGDPLRVLQGKIDDLGRAIQRLALLQAHDEELDRDAKTCVRFKDVTVLRQSIIGHLRRHTQMRVVVGTERRTKR